nr:kelch domain-containing protein 4 isoform X2 [Ipomoea batatas]
MPPGPRAGFSMCIHKKRAILFGGVVDMDIEGDVMMSLFLNELYGFQVDSHRWYPLELRKEKSSKDKVCFGDTFTFMLKTSYALHQDFTWLTSFLFISY